MDGLKLILDGIKKGDKNGGPTELVKINIDSLIACNGFNKKDLIMRYHHWWNTDAFDTGPTFAMVFEKMSQGIKNEKAVLDVDKKLKGSTAGCGPAHRIAPIAGFQNILTNDLIEIARKEAKITHYHPDAGNCSAIMALLCRYLLEGFSWSETKKQVSDNSELKNTWKNITNANFNNGGYVLDVMHTALYFLDNDKPLQNSLLFAGPANYCPVIVGIIEEIRINCGSF